MDNFETVSNAAFSGLVDEAAYYGDMGRKNNLNKKQVDNYSYSKSILQNCAQFVNSFDLEKK